MSQSTTAVQRWVFQLEWMTSLKKPFGQEAKRLQETEPSPVAHRGQALDNRDLDVRDPIGTLYQRVFLLKGTVAQTAWSLIRSWDL